MKPWDPAEVLVVIDERNRSPVAVFVRIQVDLWAKPGALMGWRLADLESDRREYHRFERHVLS